MPLNQKLNLNPNIFDKEKQEQKLAREGWGEGLVQAGKDDPNVVVLGADLSESTRTAMFRNAYPERFIQCGIAEQNMMDVAAGLALGGKIPFVSTYAVFTPGLIWSQIRVSVLQNEANVKIGGAHAGVSVGPDGMSHQALEDIALTRCLPGLTVLAPCDYVEARKATLIAAKTKGAFYLRFPREKTPVITSEQTPFEVGKALVFWEPLKPKPDAAIVVTGTLAFNALSAAKQLEEEGISVVVINNHSIKPMDKETILHWARESGAVVTVEEHQIAGGMGSAVAELLAMEYPVPMEFIGVQDRFGGSGEPNELIEKFGMGAASIAQAVKKVIAKKK
jgi:transketolase